MKNSSKQGDIVGDPFLGSGTTLIASEMNWRQCRGIELDPRYVDVDVRLQSICGRIIWSLNC
jgi:DNA modification methylase